ncbi:MAG: diguanylate cyclase, partial [Eggerthellaceae bacterium]|nr:diguanylate cyclase [Eggerthellaceae bacterium]
MTFSYVFTYFLITLVCGSIGMVILGQLSTDMGTEQEIGAFRSFIIGVLVFTFSNTVWVWINYGYLNIPGWPFSMANLIAICVASYYWFKYIELRLNPELVATIQFRVASMLPLAIAIALVLTTPFTGLVFSYEGNEYIHGPLYSTMAVLALLYLIVATVHIATKVSKVHSPSQRSQYRTLMLFLLFPMMGGIIDVIVPNLPVMELMLLFGTVLVYTNMQQTQINSDVLTGLNNRRVTDEYLLGELEHVSKENPLCFFIGDIDRFKY